MKQDPAVDSLLRDREILYNPRVGSPLPEIPEASFSARLRAASPEELSDRTVAALYQHYLELRRWNPRLSLVGPGTAEEVVERHYGESLAALPWLGREVETLVDVGSGGGFPGVVLAAARPDLRVTLVEARQRKWSFLMNAVRRGALSCACLNATVGAALPAELQPSVDRFTVRAVRLDHRLASVLAGGLASGGRILVWSGRTESSPSDLLVKTRELALPGSNSRRLIEYAKKVVTE